MKNLPIVLAGEVLFDCFPDVKVLGGAPFNVAWHLQALGAQLLFVSRVGDDANGRDVSHAMRAWQMDLSALETDPNHPTGQVTVTLNDGEPQYTIEPEQAYDFITLEHPPVLPDQAFFYHGSLAMRSSVSRASIEQLRQRYAGRVFMDVNLRAPWWRKQDIFNWLDGADWVKLNRDELIALHNPVVDLEQSLESLIKRHKLTGVVLTLGSEGAMAKRAGDAQTHRIRPQQNLKVIDAVGAGDAFAAVLLLGLSQNWPFQTILTRAQQFASLLVTRRGATIGERDFYRPLLDQWIA